MPEKVLEIDDLQFAIAIAMAYIQNAIYSNTNKNHRKTNKMENNRNHSVSSAKNKRGSNNINKCLMILNQNAMNMHRK